jgi:hypothetical protein
VGKINICTLFGFPVTMLCVKIGCPNPIGILSPIASNGVKIGNHGVYSFLKRAAGTVRLCVVFPFVTLAQTAMGSAGVIIHFGAWFTLIGIQLIPIAAIHWRTPTNLAKQRMISHFQMALQTGDASGSVGYLRPAPMVRRFPPVPVARAGYRQ